MQTGMRSKQTTQATTALSSTIFFRDTLHPTARLTDIPADQLTLLQLHTQYKERRRANR